MKKSSSYYTRPDLDCGMAKVASIKHFNSVSNHQSRPPPPPALPLAQSVIATSLRSSGQGHQHQTHSFTSLSAMNGSGLQGNYAQIGAIQLVSVDVKKKLNANGKYKHVVKISVL